MCREAGLVHSLLHSLHHAANDGLTLFVITSFLVSIHTKYQSIVGSIESATTVNCNDSNLQATAQRIVQQENPYYPTYFSVFCDYHGNLQTITQFLWRSLLARVCLSVHTHRELLYLDDGGLISLDWMGLKGHGGSNEIATASYGNDRLVIISHGLCGSARSDYIAHISDILLRAGYRVCVVIRRGCDGLHIPRPSALFQHRHCEKTDLGYAIDHIAKNNPNALLYGLGYSMGAAHWLKELGSIGNIHDAENRHNPPASNPFPTGPSRLRAAVCVCPPWDMARPTSVYAAWSYMIAVALKHHLSHHIPTLNALGVDYNDIKKARTVDDLDAQLTTLYGYDNIEEYKRKDSPILLAKQITIPTLAISSHDDPICAVDGRPTTEEFRGDGLVVVTTRYGGHLSFPMNPWYRHAEHPRSEYLSIGSWLQCSWTDGVVLDWFNAFQ